MGYVTDRNHLLYDAEEAEYNGAVLAHITFRLISLPHGMPIRVIKSVWMFGGSLSACKFLSTFLDQELLVKKVVSISQIM